MAKPKIAADCCTGCGICIDTCPVDALELKDDIAVLAKPDVCDGCGSCAESCPLECITME